MKIIYWSDYACPYCYIGAARLKKAIAAIPELEAPELQMKAFRLDPNAGLHAAGDTQTRFAGKYGISMEDAGKELASIEELARAEGLEFHYGSTLFTNTMDAHRLTKLAQSKGDPALTERITEALYRAYFTENRELADCDVLQEIGERCGLPPAELRALWATERYREEVLQDEREAAEMRIRAVPFYAVDGRYGIAGARTVEGMKATLLKAMETAE